MRSWGVPGPIGSGVPGSADGATHRLVDREPSWRDTLKARSRTRTDDPFHTMDGRRSHERTRAIRGVHDRPAQRRYRDEERCTCVSGRGGPDVPLTYPRVLDGREQIQSTNCGHSFVSLLTQKGIRSSTSRRTALTE